jgi:hypothetical protein
LKEREMDDKFDLSISITGKAASGKTWLLNVIGLSLQEKGIQVGCFDDNGKFPVVPKEVSFSLNRTVKVTVSEDVQTCTPSADSIKGGERKSKWERVLQAIIEAIKSGKLIHEFIEFKGGRCISFSLSDAMDLINYLNDDLPDGEKTPTYSHLQFRRELSYAGIWMGRPERKKGCRRVRCDALRVERLERMGFLEGM